MAHFGCCQKMRTNFFTKVTIVQKFLLEIVQNKSLKSSVSSETTVPNRAHFFVAPIICELSSLITIFVILYLNLCQNWPKDLYRYSVFMNYYEDVSRFGDIDIVLYPRNVSL